MNIWQNLKKEKIEKAIDHDGFVEPILVLAPMADVTDIAFRTVIAENGKPDVLWTEFVSADGLMLAPGDNPDDQGFTSQDKLRADLKFTKAEHPIVAQIFGSRPENIRKTAALMREMGFDGVDINMGCPDRSIEKQGCGCGMIKNPKSALAIIRAAKMGVGYEPGFWSTLYKTLIALRLNFLAYHLEYKLKTNIPVTVKTRLGYNRDELEVWLPKLLSAWPAIVTIHARTRKQMSKVPADWTRIKRAVEIRDEWFDSKKAWKKIAPENRTLIFGNGDVVDRDDANNKARETECDGVMIGRGIFGNPWLFGETKREDVSIPERLRVMVRHTKIFERELSFKNFAIMKKHYKAYVDGFDGAKDLRVKLMECHTAREVEDIVEDFIKVLEERFL
jgi:tRNA-dihydrouridine synthase